jgi:S1-C subfamily serine protease
MKAWTKIFAGLFVFLLISSSVLATDVNLPPLISKAIESRVLIQVFQENKETKEEILYTAGSGFVAADGYVITASHLFKDQELFSFLGISAVKSDLVIKISRGPDKESTKAEIVAIDFKSDIALLKVADCSKTGPPVKLAESFPKDGETVYLSGFWAGFFNATISVVVLGEIKDGASYNGFKVNSFIIDRTIPPGFSGGPVFNTKGELVGMNLFTVPNAGFGGILPLKPILEILKTKK